MEQIDEELSKGNDRTALALVKDLQGKTGGLRCFGAARQVLSTCMSENMCELWVLLYKFVH